LRFDEGDAGHRGAHEHLTRAGLPVRHLDEMKDLGRTEFVDLDLPHGEQPSC